MKVTQLCPPLSTLPGSSVYGILQARILEWVAIPFSSGSSQPGIEPRSPALQADSMPPEAPVYIQTHTHIHYINLAGLEEQIHPKDIGLFCTLFLGSCLQGAFFNLQFSSVTHSRQTLCDFMDCSMPGFPVHHQLPELAQTHVHWVDDVIQSSHPLFSLSPPALNLSQTQGLF